MTAMSKLVKSLLLIGVVGDAFWLLMVYLLLLLLLLLLLKLLLLHDRDKLCDGDQLLLVVIGSNENVAAFIDTNHVDADHVDA